VSSTDPAGADQQAQTVAVVVGKLEVMLSAVHEGVREIATRMRSVELTQAAHEARIASLETERRDASARLDAERREESARRPSWWSAAGGLAAIVSTVVAVLALGGVIHVGG
jgi:hypothetical protein